MTNSVRPPVAMVATSHRKVHGVIATGVGEGVAVVDVRRVSRLCKHRRHRFQRQAAPQVKGQKPILHPK